MTKARYNNLGTSFEERKRLRGVKGVDHCYDCPRARQVGTYCVYHWTIRSARRKGLGKQKWFRAHWKEFADKLLARYRSIETGFEPEPMEPLLEIFYHGKYKLHHKEYGWKKANFGFKLKDIVIGVDAIARRAHAEASANGSEEKA